MSARRLLATTLAAACALAAALTVSDVAPILIGGVLIGA